LASLLAACGGGGDTPTTATPAADIATATTTLTVGHDGAELSTTTAVPTFHLAPVLLDEPSDVDALNPGQSAHEQPHAQRVPAANRNLSTERLTPQRLRDAAQNPVGGMQWLDAPERESAQATGTPVVTYTPAQVRAAYGFPALPTATTGLTAAQAADLGAGQTIYIIGAQHNPNIAAELAAFNQKFGLPTCATKAIAATATLPLAAASASACEVSVVFSTATGGMTTAAPAYDSGWATEMALDVQWAHATAPLARLVVVEAADPSLNSLLGAIKLANAMGPGIVSMSLGAAEGSWTSSVESVFSTSKMTYLAATGDSGAGVSWPAVSPSVLAVSGTTLTYSSGTPRSEVVWTGTGGGVSAYTAVPSYQTSAVPGMGTLTKRAVADVAFNANPSTGQYVAVMTPGSTAVSWVSAGGTSLSTPQWAGIMAVTHAKRAAAGKAALGVPHVPLYGQISTVPTTYAAAFKDITQGSNGTCATCVGKTAYDTPTGLGTPNVSSLVSTLSGVTVTVPAPVVTPAAITGTAGTALTFTASVASSNPVTYTLTGAPSGMSVASTGVVSWAAPVAGTYAVTLTAKDTVTGQSGQGVYTVTINAAAAPVGTDTTVSGQPGVALSFTATFKSANAMTYSMTGAPTGMTINSTTGVVSWPSPVVGTYTLKISAKDTKTGLTGTATYTVKIQTATTAGPVLTVTPITGVAGKAVSGTITITDPGALAYQISITGIPLGMSFSISGSTITAYWAKPVAGSYTLAITVVDNLGLTAKASMPITISK
jgi:subtilase family serine protease